MQYGAAFFLAGDVEEQQRTLQYLEWREKQYDLRLSLDVHCRHTHVPLVRGALVYVATPDRWVGGWVRGGVGPGEAQMHQPAALQAA